VICDVHIRLFHFLSYGDILRIETLIMAAPLMMMAFILKYHLEYQQVPVRREKYADTLMDHLLQTS
jgi:hypothetical protein